MEGAGGRGRWAEKFVMRLNFFSRRRLVRLMAHRWARLLLKAVVVASESERDRESRRETKRGSK